MHNSNPETSSYKVALVGASGYSGLTLARLLLAHPKLELAATYSRQKAWRLGQSLGEAPAQSIPHFETNELRLHMADYQLIVLATPADVSAALIPQLYESQAALIDLSGAFRLAAHQYPTAYQMDPPAPQLLATSQYGLQPWTTNAQPQPKLIANPGCYATSVLMALLPLIKEQLIVADSLVIDAKSGATGAGKSPHENLLFCEIADDLRPYKIGRHQHLPEICKCLQDLTGTQIQPFFTTHLLPLRRGLSSALYARLQKGKTQNDVDQAYQKHYADAPLVRVQALTSDAATTAPPLLSLKKVVGSARTHISFHCAGDQLSVFSNIDNLMKGAASQAIENANALFGWPTHLGLEHWEALT